MVRRRTLARHTRRRQRGAGFFNTIRGLFTRKKAPQQAIPMPIQPVQPPKPGLFSRLFRRTPKQQARVTPGLVNRPIAFTPRPSYKNQAGQEQIIVAKKDVQTYPLDTESRANGVERSYGWLLGALPIRTLATQAQKTNFLIQYAEAMKNRRSTIPKGARHALQKLFFHILYNPETDTFELPEDDDVEILYGSNLPNKPSLDGTFKSFEMQKPLGKRYVWNGFGTVQRAIAELFTTDREEAYSQNMVDSLAACRFALVDTSKVHTLDAPGCASILTTPLEYTNNLFLTMVEEGRKISVAREVLVVHPHYSRITSRFRSSFYNLQNQREQVNLFSLPTLNVVQDAFRDPDGVTLVSPRLAILLQEEYPQLWTEHFSIFTDFDAIDRAVIALFQSYSILRRFYWTKNRSFCSDIYRTKPTLLGDELRNPQLGADTNSGYTFDIATFNADLIAIQLWAGGKIRYSQLFDSKFDSLFSVELRPQNIIEKNVLPWMIMDTFVEEDLVPVPPHPIEEIVREERQANPDATWEDFIPQVPSIVNISASLRRPSRNTSVIPSGTVARLRSELERQRTPSVENITEASRNRWSGSIRRRKTRKNRRSKRT
jgi:hypothetical protein